VSWTTSLVNLPVQPSSPSPRIRERSPTAFRTLRDGSTFKSELSAFMEAAPAGPPPDENMAATSGNVGTFEGLGLRPAAYGHAYRQLMAAVERLSGAASSSGTTTTVQSLDRSAWGPRRHARQRPLAAR
jgi:hypothetical protein